jgi:2-aminobenzoate-CoA ligase
VLRPEPDDVFTGSPPIGFTFGLGALVVFPLRVGASTLLLEKATPDLLAEAVARHGVTVLSTAPTAYKAILAAGLADRLAGVRRAVSAGETLPGAVWQAVHDATGLRIIDGIGATEMLHIFISAADDDIRPGCTGRAVPGYTAEIHDDDGRPVPDGTPGHLAVRGPTGCRYLDGDRQEVYVKDGWNVTGDTYLRDADGYFVYQARTDDMIVSAGYNIAGPEVEQALLAHPDVVDCAVVGAPDAERGMIVKAFVVLRPERTGEVTAEELEDFVKQRIAPYKRPRAVEFCDELPRTSTGKLQRYKLR